MSTVASAGTSGKMLLYMNRGCPYAARTELALELSGLKYDTFEVDLFNKPTWYSERVNKAGKVPVLMLDADQPTELALPESLVIVEYISDLCSAAPDATGSVFPAGSDARFKAQSRYIVERYTQLVHSHYAAAQFRGDASALPLLKAGLVEFNNLLLQHDSASYSEGGPFIQGGKNFAYADLNIAPFVARLLSSSANDLLPKSTTGATPLHVELEQAKELERVRKWWHAVQQVDAWKKVWQEEKYLEGTRKMFAMRQAAATAAAK